MRNHIVKQCQANDGADNKAGNCVQSVQEDRTAPPGRYRPLWEILKVSDGKVTHHFHQKGTFVVLMVRSESACMAESVMTVICVTARPNTAQAACEQPPPL